MYSPILQHPTLDTLGLITVFVLAVTVPYNSLDGAGGGAYALAGAQSAVVLMNWKDLYIQWYWCGFDIFNLGYFWFLVIFLLVIGDGTLIIYDKLISENPLHISVASYIGGFVIGFLLGVIVLRPRKMERWLKILTWICVVLLTILVLMSVTFLSICGRSGWCPPIKLD
ncbi:unnamed protein product [Hymenolepis diminuta]|uniref:Rhomboid domain-containing protein n=1 Tax=Hymenolepis diminuta TaxID=6216 RepID=A0A0R3SFD1_HYMDI|nr:unnamed protein product [Hymenolepis diminuta]